RFVEHDGDLTWEVPASKVGHAQYTAGAGELGNAVLLGHVESRNAGHVFADLKRVQPADVIEISGGGRLFTYRVTNVQTVPRTDVSLLAPTTTASLTLVTCSGWWLPGIW